MKRELQVEEDDEATDRALIYSVASSAVVTADDDEGCNSRKKLRLSKEQSALLEDHFKEHSTLNPVSPARLKYNIYIKSLISTSETMRVKIFFFQYFLVCVDS